MNRVYAADSKAKAFGLMVVIGTLVIYLLMTVGQWVKDSSTFNKIMLPVLIASALGVYVYINYDVHHAAAEADAAMVKEAKEQKKNGNV